MEKINKVTGGGGSDSLAFTLAEVLITLAIIGVVAALTIPTVVRNYQKQETVVRLKKTYSALANTTNLAIADHGPVTGWEVKGNNGSDAEDFANTYLIPYLKVAKNCGTRTDGDCTLRFSSLNGASTYTLNSAYSKFYLNDGTYIALWTTISGGGRDKNARIYIDINGQKKPNILGRDIFEYIYWIYYQTDDNFHNGKFVPYGYTWSRSAIINGADYSCAKDRRGELCAALIMKDGWRIADDYPW